MSKVAIQGNASGTGTLTFAAQNTNSSYTLTIPNETGTLLTDASNAFSGGLTLGGDLTLDSNGIYLGGTGAANYLDDYEEGTWTPAYSTSGGSFTYDAATQGQYTKIGNVVTLYFRIYTSSATVGSGTVSITGLPFAEAISSGSGAGSIGDCRLFAGDNPDTLVVSASVLIPYYRTSANGANTALQASDLNTGATKNLIDGQITYITS